MRRMYTVALLGTVTAAGVAAGVFFLSRAPAAGRQVDLTPLGSGRALLVREVKGDRTKSYVELLDEAGTRRWRQLVPRVGWQPRIAVGREVVLIRHASLDYKIHLRAVELSTGRTRWTQRPFGERPDPTSGRFRASSTPPLYADGVFYDFFGHAGGEKKTTAIAYAEGTGKELWRINLGLGRLSRAWLSKTYLITEQLAMTATIVRLSSRDTGEAVAPRSPLLSEVMNRACVVGNDLWYDQKGELFKLSLDTMVATKIRLSQRLPPRQPMRLVGMCATRAQRVLLGVAYGYPEKYPGGPFKRANHMALIGIDRAADAQTWELDLGHRELQDAAQPPQERERAAFSGSLPRFVPVRLARRHIVPATAGSYRAAQSETSLVIIDLDVAAITRTILLKGASRYGRLARRGDAFLFTGGGVVASMDGALGTFTNAIALTSSSFGLSLDPDDQSMWLRSGPILEMKSLATRRGVFRPDDRRAMLQQRVWGKPFPPATSTESREPLGGGQ